MEALPYLLKVNICWAAFYGCYWLLFRKHTFFKLNRAYLLFSLLVSFVIPAVELQQTVAEIPVMAGGATVVREAAGDATYLLLACYFAGVAAMLILLVRAIRNVFRIVQNGISVPMEGFQLVISPAQVGSFSFLKWMVISNDDYEQNLEPIFAHEMVHIRQWHSLDILLVEVIRSVFWFNPALWLYKRALQDTHEFLADEQAADRDDYATFLLSYAKTAVATSVTNQFFNASLLKKRIHMIYRSRTASWLRSKYLLLLPLLAVAVALMAARKYVYPEKAAAIVLPAKKDPVPASVKIITLPDVPIVKRVAARNKSKPSNDTVPVKEMKPAFWGNRSIYSPAPTPPFGKKHLKEFFEDATVDLADSVAPTTKLYRYGLMLRHPMPEQVLDLRIKFPKK